MTATLSMVPLAKIHASTDNPRSDFDDDIRIAGYLHDIGNCVSRRDHATAVLRGLGFADPDLDRGLADLEEAAARIVLRRSGAVMATSS